MRLCRALITEFLHIHAPIFGTPLKHASKNLDGAKILLAEKTFRRQGITALIVD